MKINIFGRSLKLNNTYISCLALLMVFSIAFISWLVLRDDSVIIIDKSGDKPINKASDIKSVVSQASSVAISEITSNKEPKQSIEIYVYVVGAVNKPGIYKLTKGSMINDAIVLAGGVLASADVENINMVYQLTENVMIKVKSKNTIENKELSQNQSNNGGAEIIRDSFGAIDSGGDEGEIKAGKIDINKANVGQLDTLPGVGLSTAQKIITYREKNGNFKATKDIMNVPGIGESKYETIKDLITVSS